MDPSEAKRFHAGCIVGREVLATRVILGRPPLAQHTRAARGERA
jgi:hypothetical protein